jgi:hypothetical protein
MRNAQGGIGRRKIRAASARGDLCARRHRAAGVDGVDDRHTGESGRLPGNRRVFAAARQSRTAVRGPWRARRRFISSAGRRPLRRWRSARNDQTRRKDFRPGNAYVVTAAKKLLFRPCRIDLLPGPSELLIIADDSAESRVLSRRICWPRRSTAAATNACGLCQPRKGIGSRRKRRFRSRLGGLQRREFVERALQNGGVCILAKDMQAGHRDYQSVCARAL